MYQSIEIALVQVFYNVDPNFDLFVHVVCE